MARDISLNHKIKQVADITLLSDGSATSEAFNKTEGNNHIESLSLHVEGIAISAGTLKVQIETSDNGTDFEVAGDNEVSIDARLLDKTSKNVSSENVIDFTSVLSDYVSVNCTPWGNYIRVKFTGAGATGAGSVKATFIASLSETGAVRNA